MAGGVAVGGVIAGTSAVPAEAGGRSVPLVKDGVAKAVVVLRSDASKEILTAGADLVRYVQQSTGVALPTLRYTPGQPLPATATGKIKLYLGFAGPGTRQTTQQVLNSKLSGDGFAIWPQNDTITIAGATEAGSFNGVHGFLREHLGMEWLMPSPVGEDVPRRTELSVPVQPQFFVPAFLERMLSPLHVSVAPSYGSLFQWGQRQGLHHSSNWPIRFHHNLHTLFPVAEFGTTHPEYYPGGRPPAPGVTTGWQPVMTEPGTIEVAVQKIKKYFTDNPAATSFSLGVNDGGGFAEANPVGPYYHWVNAVVEQVTRDFPDKWFGLLAYLQLETPPDFALHERVVPFLTQDRMAWARSDVEQRSKALLDTWNTVTSQMGLYDYVYGAPYMVPRVYPHHTKAVIDYARSIGVVALYSEMYPNWGEGPKPWIHARLMWDPDQDVDEMVRTWCIRAAGEAAAPYLVEYYALWEKFWLERAPHTAWFQPNATYQAFNAGNYLDAVTADDITRSRELLDAAVARPGTDAQQVRVGKLRRAFEYYEASALSYPKSVAPPTTSAGAIALLGGLQSTWQQRAEAAQRRLELHQEFKTDSVLNQPGADLAGHGLVWGAWNTSEFWGVADFVRDHEPNGGEVTTWLTTNAGSVTDRFGEYLRLLLGVAQGQIPSKIVNNSFESVTAGADGKLLAPPWDLWVASDGALVPSTSQARTGTHCVAVQGLKRGGPNQRFDVRPGLIATRSYILARGASYNGTVGVAMNIGYRTGSTEVQMGVLRGTITGVVPSPDWIQVTSLFEIPEVLKDPKTQQEVPVTRGQYVLILDGFAHDPEMFIDDIDVWQTP